MRWEVLTRKITLVGVGILNLHRVGGCDSRSHQSWEGIVYRKIVHTASNGRPSSPFSALERTSFRFKKDMCDFISARTSLIIQKSDHLILNHTKNIWRNSCNTKCFTRSLISPYTSKKGQSLIQSEYSSYTDSVVHNCGLQFVIRRFTI